ncbi:MAG TPA: general secretion pathway protein GspE [Verrucomicrobia bacterium]|nr:general secretion pathway protein GspE [Verrucomicrobiota bacterium]
MKARPKLGQMLVDGGLLKPDQLDQAITACAEAGERLGEYLCSKGIIREDQLVELLGRQLKVLRYDPERYPLDMALASLVPVDLAQRLKVVPLTRRKGTIELGMSDPTDLGALDAVEQLTRCEVLPVICTDREINQLTNGLYGSFAGIGDVAAGTGDSADASGLPSMAEDVEVGSLKSMAEGAPVIRMVNWIISQAAREGASDIHISPEANYVQLRFRIDGRLRDEPAPPKSLHLSVVSRIKILAQMDIAVSRIPQDGRFTVKLDNREINIRVSTIPTTNGENVVMRLLDMGAFNYSMFDLGMSERDREKLSAVIEAPYGMILSTGPTGSGKTTTLYAMLKELNKPDVHIITVEDPVEYRVAKIRQVQLNTKAGMTFASALRSILRQDPDVIMVGEIRDAETARIATQAALTGHRVLSTVHTNDAAGAITRLIDMGIEPFLIASVLLVSFAQRLVRKVCPHCAIRVEQNRQTADFWGVPPKETFTVMQAKGCARCQHTGYQGRTGIYEVLMIDDMIRELIARKSTTAEINQAARAAGRLRTLKEDALDKLRAGVTTIEEAMSVVYI